MTESAPPYLGLAPSPCFVLEEERLRANLEILGEVQQQSGAKILLALKAFAMFSVFDIIAENLCGAAASGIYEARLAAEEMGKAVHTFCPAIKDEDFDVLAKCSDHLIFNSLSQWQRFKEKAAQLPGSKFGLRVNPCHSEGAVPIYDPCAPLSRLGITAEQLVGQDLTGLSGLHFHTLCEQGFAPLARTFDIFEKQFGHLLESMQWLNLGGGHLISRPDYDRQALIDLLRYIAKRYDVQVYIEPGEAISLETGTLVAEVVDIVRNDMDIAILDVSAATHMPDVLEMPYRPHVINSGLPGEKGHDYRLAGPSCLAGDIIGDYSFTIPLSIGQRLAFTDMIHYTMVKTNTFNGVPLPSIAIWRQTQNLEIVRRFDYLDFKNRLS